MDNAGGMTTARALPRTATVPGWVRGILELTLILALWVFYSLARLLADTNMQPALHRANELLHVESVQFVAEALEGAGGAVGPQRCQSQRLGRYEDSRYLARISHRHENVAFLDLQTEQRIQLSDD